MALIKCPECGNEISDRALKCPNCGYPINDKKKENVETKRTTDDERLIFTKGVNKKIVVAIIVGIIVLIVGIYIITRDTEPPELEKWTDKVVFKVGDEIDDDEILKEIKVKDDSGKVCEVVFEDEEVDYDVAGSYYASIIVTDAAGNETVKTISVDIENYPTYDAYLAAVNLTEDDLEEDSGSKIYKGLVIPADEAGNVEKGTMYRTVATQLEGFKLFPELYSSWGKNLIPLVWGFEKPETSKEMEEYVSDLIKYVSNVPCLGQIMYEFEQLDSVDGDFDYINGHFSFEIADLTAAAKELGITETMLGYTLAFLEEYAPKTEFNKNTYKIDLQWFGADRTFSDYDFEFYEQFSVKKNMLTDVLGAGEAYYIGGNNNDEIDIENGEEDRTGHITIKGVQLGCSIESVIFAHGGGDLREFDKAIDPVYYSFDTYLNKGYYMNGCTHYMVFNSETGNQMMYYFDEEGNIMCLVYSKGYKFY